MTIWSGEIKELDKVYSSLKGQLPDILKEMEQLIRTDDPNVVMLYSRRCLEVIVTDLCETELKRPRKTEPLKGIIDKLNSEEKVPSYIITSMLSLNSMATYGAHPKDFDPEQVRPVLNNLTIIIKWYLKYKDYKVVSTTELAEEKKDISEIRSTTERKPVKKKSAWPFLILILVALAGAGIWFFAGNIAKTNNDLIPVRSGIAFVDPRDNQVYRTVTIGSQTWMAENLKAVKFNDGTPIPMIKDEKEWENMQSPGYCWYGNNKKMNRDVYGALYNWFAVNTGKLCPVGWHVPSSDEWLKLKMFAGDSIDWIARGDTVPIEEIAGRKLKEPSNMFWETTENIYSTDEFGFSALPAGDRTIYGAFWGIGQQGCWWSSTEDSRQDGKNVEMNYNSNSLIEIQQYKQFGMSVRCIKDN
jgi:uncharacterized protein (TIGR02145 family)